MMYDILFSNQFKRSYKTTEEVGMILFFSLVYPDVQNN